MKRLVPSPVARLLIATPAVALLVGPSIVMVAGSGPSPGYLMLAGVGTGWLARCLMLDVRWNDDCVQVRTYLRVHSLRWQEVEDIAVGHTTSIAVRGVPFAVPKLLLSESREVKVIGLLGVSRRDMNQFVDEVTRLTAGRAAGVGHFQSYSPWCKPSALSTHRR